MITQLAETLEKANIDDIQSVTTEQPKTVTKLSKPIKQLKLLLKNNWL